MKATGVTRQDVAQDRETKRVQVLVSSCYKHMTPARQDRRKVMMIDKNIRIRFDDKRIVCFKSRKVEVGNVAIVSDLVAILMQKFSSRFGSKEVKLDIEGRRIASKARTYEVKSGIL